MPRVLPLARSLASSLAVAVAVAAAVASCARTQSRLPLNDGTLSRHFDPYTGKPTLTIDYVVEPVPAPKIDRDASDSAASFAMSFIRDPAVGDVVVLRARQECWYNLDGKRVECLPAACSVRPQTVQAYGRLDGTPAQLPRFECKGWGRAAVEYVATFTRPAMHAIASATEFWIRVPTGEVRMTTKQIANLRGFMDEVERTPAHLGPASVDLRQ